MIAAVDAAAVIGCARPTLCARVGRIPASAVCERSGGEVGRIHWGGSSRGGVTITEEGTFMKAVGSQGTMTS